MTFLSRTDFVHTTANIATVLFALFIGIQLLLASGILPVSIAWGGRQTELTPTLRVTSIVAAIILGIFIYIIRYRAGLTGSEAIPIAIRISSWVVTAYMAFNTLGNLASTSNTEKLLFGPITFLLTIACIIISVSKIDCVSG